MAKKNKTELITEETDPRRLKFLALYTNPSSPTFGNLRGSGIDAGLSAKYAENIGNKKPKWFTDYLGEFGGDLKRLEQAEKVFDRVLNEDYVETAIGAFGVIVDKETGKPMKRVNTQIMDKNLKAAQFIGETIGRNKYSKKIELVGGFSNTDVKEYD